MDKKEIANILQNCHIEKFMDIHDNHHVEIHNHVESPHAPQLSHTETDEDDEDISLSLEENAKKWAKRHFDEIDSIYTTCETLAKKAENICRLYEEEKAKHDEGDRWRTSYLKNLFYPDDPNYQWLKDTSMSFGMFSELIRDEKVDKSIFSKTKNKYKYNR